VTQVRIAYLVNQYPRTSHSFIRREIHALEELGFEVLRFSQRPLRERLASEEDAVEARRTRAILDEGWLRHLLLTAATALGSPRRFLRALGLAVRIGWRSERGVLRHLAYLAEACVLLGWVREACVDHVHAHFGTNSTSVALLCDALGGPPYSFTVHGPEEFDKPSFISLGEKIRRARFVVAISSFGRSQLWRWSPHPEWHKIHVVRCGVSEDLLRAHRTPVPSAPRLVCVARLSEQKGHLLLLEAAARVVAEGIPLELVLAGDGPIRADLEAFVRRAGLEDRVRFAGWMGGSQVRDAILGARALVLPSFAEGLPVVLMEALALRRPVITTAVAGIPELVETGVTGWLVPAGAVEALAQAMKAALAADPADLERMGAAGAARVARDHDAGNEARKLAELFRAGAGGAR
jgi:glycosyltransferase involved in cell wall biosynthesis